MKSYPEFWVTHMSGVTIFKRYVLSPNGRTLSLSKLKSLIEEIYCPEDYTVTEWCDDEIIMQINAEEFIRDEISGY